MSENIKPVTHQYLFTSPFGDGEVWRDNQTTWNGQYAKQSRPLYDQSAIEAARQESAAEIADLRRQLAAAQSSRNELRDLIKSLVTQQVDRKKNPVHIEPQNHPDHGHEVIGIWDDDNGDLAGKPCALCAIWNKAIEEANRTVINDYSALDTLLAAKERETIERCKKACDERAERWALHGEEAAAEAHEAKMCAAAIGAMLQKGPSCTRS